MSDLTRWSDPKGVEPLKPINLGVVERFNSGRSLSRLHAHTDLEATAAELRAELGQVKIQAVAHVANAAMTTQALLSGREQLLVEAEPEAAQAIQALSRRTTLAFGEILDDVANGMLR